MTSNQMTGTPQTYAAVSLQEAADRLGAVIVKEDLVDGMRIWAYPVRRMQPVPAVTADGIRWHVPVQRINITPEVDVNELTAHNSFEPVYPRYNTAACRRLETLLSGTVGLRGGGTPYPGTPQDAGAMTAAEDVPGTGGKAVRRRGKKGGAK